MGGTRATLAQVRPRSGLLPRAAAEAAVLAVSKVRSLTVAAAQVAVNKAPIAARWPVTQLAFLLVTMAASARLTARLAPQAQAAAAPEHLGSTRPIRASGRIRDAPAVEPASGSTSAAPCRRMRLAVTRVCQVLVVTAPVRPMGPAAVVVGGKMVNSTAGAGAAGL